MQRLTISRPSGRDGDSWGPSSSSMKCYGPSVAQICPPHTDNHTTVSSKVRWQCHAQEIFAAHLPILCLLCFSTPFFTIISFFEEDKLISKVKLYKKILRKTSFLSSLPTQRMNMWPILFPGLLSLDYF